MLDKYKKQIAASIKKARLERRWRQTELAKKLGISQARLSEIEGGKGSITAEQLVVSLQLFNLPLSYFVKTEQVDEEAQLQNVIARLGASQLREDPNVLPSEKLNEVNKVILETLVSGPSARLITGLTPIIVHNAQRIKFIKIYRELQRLSLHIRLYWLINGILGALNERLESFVPRKLKLIYRKAHLILHNVVFYNNALSSSKKYQEDQLDSDITSKRTLNQIKESRDELAKKWNIITRIKEEDFLKALLDAEQND